MNNLKKNDNATIISNTIIFVIPCLSFLEIRLVGRLFISEILMLLAIAFQSIVNGLVLDRRAKLILKLASIWLFAQVITDLLRGSTFEDYSRGWAKIFFFTINFCFMAHFLRARKAILAFSLGYIISMSLKFFIDPREIALLSSTDSFWKFGYGYSVTLGCVALLIPLHSRVMLCGTGLLAIAATNLLMGFRSLSLFVLITAAIQFLRSSSNKIDPFNVLGRILRVTSALIFICIIFTIIYEYALDHAWTEYSLRDKQNKQSGDFGSFFGGRAEIWASSHAIIDSPIIGHGSWAKNPIYAEYLLELNDYGYNVVLSAENRELIPTHSYIFGAWVEAGILGIFIWCYVLSLAFRAVFISFVNISRLSPLVELMSLALIWAVLFSPFGATERISAALSLVIVLWLIGEHEHHIETQ